MAATAEAAMGTGLTFTKMTDKGIWNGMDLTFNLVNRDLQAYLCVGTAENRVKITGTTPLTRQADVLKAIDNFGKWGEEIDLWMVGEKSGDVQVRTERVKYKTHVKPYYGALNISGISSDNPAMTYPGNGVGRVLSRSINGRYYFTYGGKLETDNAMRGFDCTSFPMVLFSIRILADPGYGKQLSDAAKALPCGFEQQKSADIKKHFAEDTIPGGQYILFSAKHVLLYNSDINTLYEFTYGGFNSCPAETRELSAPQDLWWLRKLPDVHRAAFS